SRVVLTPRRWRQVPGKQASPGMTVARTPDHREEHEVNRKTIAQGMSDRLRCPVCSCAFFAQFAHETVGCSAHPAFPAPSDLRERKFLAKLGHIGPRECGVVAETLTSSSPRTRGPICGRPPWHKSF